MISVEFLGPIDEKTLNLDIDNLNQLSDILSDNIKLKDWLDICAVAVNDVLISDKNIALNDGDKVSLLPPVCGG